MNRLAIVILFLVGSASHAWCQTSFSSPETGHKVLGSYFGGEIDTVSLTNGNLHLDIPLFTLPGRELPLSLGVSYDNRFVERRMNVDEFGNPTTEYWEFYGWRKTSAVGGQLVASKVKSDPYANCAASCTWNITFTWVQSTGTKQSWTTQVQVTANNIAEYAVFDNLTLSTKDSEFLRLYTGTHFNPFAVALYGAEDPAVIKFKNGNKMIFNGTTQELRSTNGNRLTVNGTGTSAITADGSLLHDVVPLSDTTGRTISHSRADTETFTLTDANGQSKIYRIHWASVAARSPNDMVNTTFRVVTSIDLPNNTSYQFLYDVKGNLSKVTFPTGAYIRYTYTMGPDGWLVQHRIVSADGLATSEKDWWYTYGYSIYDGGGNYFHWLSGANVHPPDGTTEEHLFTFPSCAFGGVCVGQEYRTSYKSGSTTLKQIDKSWSTGDNVKVQSVTTTLGSRLSRTDYTHDANNNVIEQRDYDFGLNAVGSKIRTIVRTYATWPDSDHIFDRVATEDIYDGGGAVIAKTQFEYDNYTAQPLVTRTGTIPGWTSPGARANVTAVKSWLNTNNTWLSSGQQYDVLGNLGKVTDPAGHITQTDFTDRFSDNASRNSFAFSTRVTNPAGSYVDTTLEFNTGLVTQVKDSLNRTTTMTYDAMNRQTAENYPNGGWTHYTYDDTTPKATKEIRVDSANNVGRVITTFDKLYRIIKTETADPGGNIFVETQYDSKGRKWKVSNPYRAGETLQWTQFAYDATDRPTLTTATDNSTVQYAYNGNQTTVTDEAGNQRRYTYNALGNMTKVEEPNPTLATPLSTTYSYNVLGKLTQTSQGSQLRTFNFDSLGRMTSQQLPESGTTSFTYNADSLLLTKTDFRGITTSVTYGTSGSGGHYHDVYSRSYSDGTPTVSFNYNTQGLRTSMTDALGTVTYSYDSNTDKLTQESRSLTGVAGTFTTGYAYNIKGNLTQMTYPSGRVVNMNYATGGGCCNSRLSSVVDQTTGVTLSSSMAYNAAGETLSRTLGNGVVETFGYNTRLQATTITATSGSTTLMNFTYDYGTSATNTGRVLSRTDSIQPEHSAKYTYDSLYRLGQVVAADPSTSWGIMWTFDIWGNRLTQTPQALTTSKVGTQTLGYYDNKLTGSGSYDWAGNRTNDGLHSYTFNAENQITQTDGGAAVYGYDGEGRRMKKTVGSETTYYFYGVGGLLCEFTTTNTGATQAASTDRATYRTSDRLGSAVLIMAAAGTIIENNRTLPYGEAWLSEVASTNDKKFTTYQRDQESGLDYAMGRYYANTGGRFLSVDPASATLFVPASLNRYVYTMNDPINYTDPTGEIPEPIRVWNGEKWVTTGFFPLSRALRRIQSPFIYLIREREEQERERQREEDQRRQNGPECDKSVIDAMKKAWSASGNGTTGTEAGFLVIGGANGIEIVALPYTNERGRITLDGPPPPGTVALFHVHPNTGAGRPSDQDIRVANIYGLQMFSFGRDGLWKYDRKEDVVVGQGPQPDKLANGLNWTKPCPQ